MAELMSMSDVDHQVVEKQPVDRKAFSPEDVAEMLVAQAGKQKQQQALLFHNKPSQVLLATVVQQNASNFIHLSANGSVNSLFLSFNWQSFF
ncbi:hypothetical protein T4B_8972 [Trichinella pseudospiralis]|uniref:Uncharacterized protein n=1 Tax=Trichinella pseudospiralis TaxID=6337 RepID=A0A0V1IAT0_TRIPS|nr:hypothetical protein T4B_8972 [Trichinella pseudospiralis]KRZ28219.1 hypothetical protein T4C_13838 [Trichinella pseudospiralis]